MHQKAPLRILILGMNPSGKYGKSKSLHRLKEWTDRMGLMMYSFDNIYPYVGEFKVSQIDKQYIKNVCTRYDKVLALGTKVSNLLHDLAIDHCMLPHPSGLNRRLNDPEYVHERLESCKNYLERGSQ